MAKKTYKQWYDYHYKRFKKENPSINELMLRDMATNAANTSMRSQQEAENSALRNVPRVGPEATMMPVPEATVPAEPVVVKNPLSAKPTPTLSATTQPPGGATYNDRIQQRIKAAGAGAAGPYTFTGPSGQTATGYDMPTFLRDLEKEDYILLQKQLKLLGYNAKNKEEVNQILSQVFPHYFPTLDLKTLLAKLKSNELPGAGEEPQLPDRRIGQIDRGALVELAQAVAAKGMFELSEQELNDIIAPWESKLKQGTLTTTKKVRNPKTGKLENVTTTTAAFRQGEEELALEKKLRAAKPEQFALAEGIGFNDEVKKLLGGGI